VMSNPSDEIARAAARLLMEHTEGDIRSAIRAARSQVDGDPSEPPPTRERVRRHLVAMQQQSMGYELWARLRLGMLAAIEECMVALAWAIDDIELRLAGEAARGQFDGTTSVSMRLHSTIDDRALFRVLEDIEFEIAAVGVQESRHGRLTRIVAESEEFDLVILRCPQRTMVEEPVNLVTGRPVPIVDQAALAALIAQGLSDVPPAD